MSIINRALMDFLVSHELPGVSFNAEKFYEKICYEFPQLNYKTTIRRMDSYEYAYAEPIEFNLYEKAWYKGKGIKARLWRSVGELFNKKSWYNKGMILDDRRDVPMPKTHFIKLQPYSYGDAYNFYATVFLAYLREFDMLLVK